MITATLDVTSPVIMLHDVTYTSFSFKKFLKFKILLNRPLTAWSTFGTVYFQDQLVYVDPLWKPENSIDWFEDDL